MTDKPHYVAVAILCLAATIAVAPALGAAPKVKRENATALSCSEPDQSAETSCPDPGVFLAKLLDTVNKSQNISDVISALGLPRNTVVGAHTSTSLQASRGTDDPRIYLFTPCGPLTLTLYGKSIEMGIIGQKADPDLTDPVGGGFDRINTKDHGEILVDLYPFPRGTRRFTAHDIVNAYNPEYAKLARQQHELEGKQPTEPSITVKNGEKSSTRIFHDTKKCSACHADVGTSTRHTGGSLGQKPLTVGTQLVNAVVSAYERSPGETVGGTHYCLPNDLRKLRACTCGTTKNDRCRQFESGTRPDEEQIQTSGAEEDAPTITVRLNPIQLAERKREACRRIRAVLRLSPRPHCKFQPAASECVAR